MEVRNPRNLDGLFMLYSAILLAGGEGRRFRGSSQEYKAFIKFKGIPLFLRVLQQLPGSSHGYYNSNFHLSCNTIF